MTPGSTSPILPGPSTHSSTSTSKRLRSIPLSILKRRWLTKLVFGGILFLLFFNGTRFWSERVAQQREALLPVNGGEIAGEGEGEGDPGIVVGKNGIFKDIGKMGKDAVEEMSKANEPLQPGSIAKTNSGYEYRVLDAQDLVKDLPEFPPNDPEMVPLSELGMEAENAFKFGVTNMGDYEHHLTSFIKHHFPPNLHQPLLTSLSTFLTSFTPSPSVHSHSDPPPHDLPEFGSSPTTRSIWMTDKTDSRLDTRAVRSWTENNDGWEVRFLDDADAGKAVTEVFEGWRVGEVWEGLPSGILKSDMLRYLLLYLHGGIYTDLDTKRLKPISDWGRNPTLYKNGEGWLYPASTEEGGKDFTEEEKQKLREEVLRRKPSLIVGLETDVGDREDWHDWWPRAVQVVQWTIASTPHHPILLDTLLSITRATSSAHTWLLTHPPTPPFTPIEIHSEPKSGGPVGVMEWTGPGVWTDAVLRYLRVKYGLKWTELKGLRRPLRVGEVVVLPVTGFSPGVGLFGAGTPRDEEAMVEHLFAGTWKDNGRVG